MASRNNTKRKQSDIYSSQAQQLDSATDLMENSVLEGSADSASISGEGPWFMKQKIKSTDTKQGAGPKLQPSQNKRN